MGDLNRNIKIYIDNSDAMSSAEKLRNKITQLNGDLKLLAEQGKKDTVGYQKQKKDLDKHTQAYGVYQNKIRETERVLKNLSGATTNELQAVRRTLRKEMGTLNRGTETYNRNLKLQNQVQKEITIAQREMNSQYGKQGSMFGKMTNGFNKYFGIATAFIASITGASFAFRKLSQDAAKMEDTYADVMKTTDLSREMVGELNEEFKRMDTRTAREQLNLLARDAGKLGMSTKKDILDFVEAGNIINVALGEDLGEDAIKSIGKMSNVFQKATKEIADQDLKGRMLSIGSAVNEVAQSSSASEPYLVAFAGRLGGVAAQAGIGIDKILGFASALDQDMQAVEMSATALQKFIITLMSKPAEFAALAKMEVGAFTQLLKTDANEAIKTVLRSLNEKGGFQELIPVFQEMGLDGARAVGVLSSMANGIDRIDEAQSIANKSMIEATSVLDEYNVKNENAQAELEKRQKAFKDAAEELGNRLNPALLKSTNYLTYLIKVLPDVLDFFAKWGPMLVKTVALMLVYNTALKVHALITSDVIRLKGLIIIETIKETLATSRLSLQYVFASRSLGQLRMSMRALFATMRLNPYALAATAVAALIYGLVKLTSSMKTATTASQKLFDATDEGYKNIAKERAELDLLLKVAKNEHSSKENRLAAIKKLNEISPEYLSNLNLENINTNKARESVEKYTTALLKNAKTKAIRSKIEDLYEKETEYEIAYRKAKALADKNQGSGDTVSFGGDLKRGIQESRARKQLEATRADLEEYKEIYEGLIDTEKVVDKSMFQEVKLLEKDKEHLKEMQEKQAQMDAQRLLDEVLDPGPLGKVNWWKQKQDFELASLAAQIESKKELIKKREEILKVEPVSKEEETVVTTPAGGSPEKDKDIYKERLALLDAYLDLERNKILQSRMDGTLNQEQYLRELELLEMDGMIKKMNIYEIDSQQQIQVQNLIFDKKIQIMQKLQDEEIAFQKKLSDIQKAADKARAEGNWANLKQIAKQNDIDAKASFDKQNKQRAEMFAMGMDFSNDMGQMVGGFISGNDDIVASSLKNIINMGLDMLKVQVQMAVAGATAMSLAQPDSVLTFGTAGFARAAIMVGLIEGAFAAVKGVVSSAIGNMGSNKASATISNDALTGQRVVTQRASGKYDVIGADDGRTYSNIPYIGDARTGIVSTPTLMGEYGSELVVNAPDFKALQRHVNYPIVLQAIQQSRQPSRVPQRGDGNYSEISNSSPQLSTLDNRMMSRIEQMLDHIIKNGVKAPVVLSDLQRKQELLSTSQKIGSK